MEESLLEILTKAHQTFFMPIYTYPLCGMRYRRTYLFNQHVEYSESVSYARFFLWLDFPRG